MDKLIENWTVLEMLKRRLMDAESLGGQCEIDAEELSAAIKVIERAVEALTGLLDAVKSVNQAQGRIVVDLHATNAASETLSLINGVEK